MKAVKPEEEETQNFLSIEESLYRVKKTKKEILADLSFETQVHDIFNPEFSESS